MKKAKMNFPGLGAAWLLAPLLLWSCNLRNPSSGGEEAELLRIASGTSFGFCIGYCSTELDMDSTAFRYVQRGRGDVKPSYPDRTIYASFDSTVWRILQAAFDWEKFAALDSVLGCPDCNDGGAEWVEVETSAGRKRVTFEFGKPLPGLDDFIATLRNARSAFRELLDASRNGKEVKYIPRILLVDLPPDSLLADAYRIDSARVKQDSLILQVQHGGGCAVHFFALYMAPDAFMESFPPQANLYLHHNANGDACKALITQRLAISLEPLLQQYERFYGGREEVALNLYEFSEGIVRRAITVSWKP